jgi:hypothetical protein
MKLPRPHIPLAVRVEVAERQFDALPIRRVIDPDHTFIEYVRTIFLNKIDREEWRRAVPVRDRLKLMLRFIFGEAKVHLDHDPPLGARVKIKRGGVIIGYRPAANDPRHLVYRTAAEHRIKTNVRGEHGQHPDRVLIKKQRRRERPARPKPKRKWPSRPFPKGRKLRSK